MRCKGIYGHSGVGRIVTLSQGITTLVTLPGMRSHSFYILRKGLVKMIDLFHTTTFTRSDGTLFSRIYERLTRASRRRDEYSHIGQHSDAERAYRRGVKDTLEALREELGG